MIYFDNGATSFPKPEQVYERTMEAMKDYGANPGRSGHRLALKTSRGIYKTRNSIAKLFNIDNPMNLIFTFNCTESLNLGIKGILKKGDHVITTSMEHNSVLRPINKLKDRGEEATIVRAGIDGNIDPKNVLKATRENTKLIVMTHVSNLTGTIMPIEEVGKIAQDHGIIFMVDGAQSAGVYDIDVERMKIDLLAFPGHKGLLGPQGTGGLYISEDLDLEGVFQGGTGSDSESLAQPNMRPDKYESGTLNGPGIIGLGAGLDYIQTRGIVNIRRHEEELTRYFIEECKKIEAIKLYGPLDIERQAAVVALNVGNLDSSEISYILDERYNIAVRGGLHCAPLAHETIGSLDQGAVRFSFGIFNSLEEVEKGIKALREIIKSI